jgi:hypothetical protein
MTNKQTNLVEWKKPTEKPEEDNRVVWLVLSNQNIVTRVWNEFRYGTWEEFISASTNEPNHIVWWTDDWFGTPIPQGEVGEALDKLNESIARLEDLHDCDSQTRYPLVQITEELKTLRAHLAKPKKVLPTMNFLQFVYKKTEGKFQINKQHLHQLFAEYQKLPEQIEEVQ